jgi:hypothetical protein
MRSRRAVTALFLLNGAITASVDVSIPRLTVRLHVSPGAIGAALLLSSIVALVAMRASAGAITRVGSRLALWSAACIVPALLMVPLGVGGYAWFCVGLALTGAVDGVYDVALQTQAVNVERAAGRPVMGGLHAAWSIGAILGALWGSGAAVWDMSMLVQAMVFAAVGVPIAALAGPRLLPDAPAPRDPAPAAKGRARRSGYTRIVVILGLLGAACELSETGVGAWCGVYVHDVGQAALRFAPMTLVVFTAAATVARVIADRIQLRFRSDTVLRGGAVLAAAGLVVVVIGRPLWALVAGFAILSAGLSVAVPILIGAVGRAEDGGASTASRVASYSTLSALGMLSGPAVFGWVGQVAGFRASFAFVAFTVAGLLLFARLVSRPSSVDAGVAAQAGVPERPGADVSAEPDEWGRDRDEPRQAEAGIVAG